MIKKVNFKEILFQILLGIMIFSTVFIFSILYYNLQNDNLWLYNMSFKMSHGLMPYRDFNMIVTPLFFQLAARFHENFWR